MSFGLIDTLFVVALIGLLVVIVMLIVTLYRANHVLSSWTRVSDTASDALVRLIPAVLNVAVVGKGIAEILSKIAEHKKADKK
ncbi:MAG: hypothetical protein Q7S37_04200 [bacterium]|nr:hypothetical protein [bacterium]